MPVLLALQVPGMAGLSPAAWPEAASEGETSAPRLYDGGTVEDWSEILVRNRSSLLLCADDDVALDRQAQALLQALRRAESVETALLFEMDRTLLLERFNRLLGSMTVEQARAGGAAVARVWVYQVQTRAELDQARLLMRLSQDLPGSGVLLLLLAPVGLARELAPEGSSRRLQVRVIGDPWASVLLSKGDERKEPPHLAPIGSGPAPQAVSSSRRGANARTVALTGVTLLLASAGAVLWWRPPGFSPPPAAVPADPPRAQAAPLEPASQADAASAPGRPVGDGSPAPASPAVSAAPMAPAAPAPDRPPGGTVVPVAGGKSLPPAVEAAAPPREQVARTASWIDSQPESSWLVQHAVSWRASDMLDLRSRQPALADARVVALFRNDGRVYYALVSGPFDTAADARAFDKDLPKLQTPSWVRSVARVKRELEDPSGLAVPRLPAPPPR
jgi:hypothetical protein